MEGGVRWTPQRARINVQLRLKNVLDVINSTQGGETEVSSFLFRIWDVDNARSATYKFLGVLAGLGGDRVEEPGGPERVIQVKVLDRRQLLERIGGPQLITQGTQHRPYLPGNLGQQGDSLIARLPDA